MKKLLIFLLTICLCLSPFTSFATENNDDYRLEAAEISVNAKSAVLMEASTGRVLYAMNESEALPPASVTKIMTLLLVAEALEQGRIALGDRVTVSENASSMGGSQVFLKEGEVMTVEELLKCTVIASANDAAVALAEKLYGSEAAFVKAMNKRANELGMSATVFENATGLDDSTTNHVTSAMDIAIMTRELLKHSVILKYSSLWQDSIRNGEFTLTNTNRLVRYYEGCNGLKTGSTDKAGFCISATAKRDDMQLIAVIMGAETRDERNAAARSLLDLGFSTYAIYKENAADVERVPVHGGIKGDCMVSTEGFSVLINKSDLKRVEKQYQIPEYLNAPVKCGDSVGYISYTIDGKKLYEEKIIAVENVDRNSFWTLLLCELKCILCGRSA